MKDNRNTIAIGLTQPFSCSYIPSKQEQLIVLQEEYIELSLFEHLLSLGFRRSADKIYRPQCPNCQSCIPIRVPITDFSLSKRQKRTLKNNQDTYWTLRENQQDNYYPLYAEYINTRHHDGSMFPATPEQYLSFIQANWIKPLFIELWLERELIGIAITDELPSSLSATYSFFSPKFPKRSLGVLLILLQCQLAKQMGKEYLYLGYQVDSSPKMNYKRLYRPYQILTDLGWVSCSDKTREIK